MISEIVSAPVTFILLKKKEAEIIWLMEKEKRRQERRRNRETPMEISPYCLLSLLPIFLLSGFSLSCNSFSSLFCCIFFLFSCSLYENKATLLKFSGFENVQMMNLIVMQPQAELFFRQGQVMIILPNS